MPPKLEDGILYVSIRFRIVSHNCCCGCGNEVVTNLSPAGWQLIYDGESISLYPSIGNWTLPCRSHYWIKNNTVEWAATWSKKRILAAQRHDALSNEKHYGGKTPQGEQTAVLDGNDSTNRKPKEGLRQKLRKWFK